MIGFVIHGPYTDGAYAYSILTPGTFRHSYYMTMVIWSLSILTMNNEGQGVLLQRVGLEILGGCKNSCLLQHEQSSISFDEIFRRGNLLAHCDILVNHFPTIKTFLISVLWTDGNPTTIKYRPDRNSVHVYHMGKGQDTGVVLHPLHQSSRTVQTFSRRGITSNRFVRGNPVGIRSHIIRSLSHRGH
jgi:hypothetical protein